MSARTPPVPTLAALLALAACAAAPPATGPATGAGAASPPAPPSAGADGSYDWHGLLIVPFGTVLKASPIPLHEVLLFHDEDEARGTADPQDCYAVDGAPPRFLGAAPEEYLLCFGHDRLNRIDASVRVANAQAEQTFARACALWLKSPTPVPATDRRCAGRDAGVLFSARLADLPGETDARLSMTLSPVAADDAAGAAVPPVSAP